MKQIDYPFFNTGLGTQSDNAMRDWTPKQADQYFEWLLNNMDKRVCILLDYFNETLAGTPEEVLGRLGEKAAKSLSNSDFASPDGDKIKLTNRGYALAADMGLLLAKFILEAGKPKVQWSIVRKPKSDMNYNAPVLIGLDPIYHIDPIGSSLVCAWRINRDHGPDIWKKTYERWRGKIGSSYPKNCSAPKWYKP